jgi:hypothetical protein
VFVSRDDRTAGADHSNDLEIERGKVDHGWFKKVVYSRNDRQFQMPEINERLAASGPATRSNGGGGVENQKGGSAEKRNAKPTRLDNESRARSKSMEKGMRGRLGKKKGESEEVK